MKKCNNKIGVVLVYMAVLIFNLFFSDISSAATQQELLVNMAVSQVGIQERSVGSDDIFYNDWYYGRRVTNGFSGQYAWCAVFVSWCANQVGISTDIIPKTASTTNMKDGLISRGGTQHLKGSGYTPQTGDIIFFGSNASQHVGIVNYTSGSTVYYIDGNNVSMSPHGVHSSSCSLSYSSLWGFVTPNYTNSGHNPTGVVDGIVGGTNQVQVSGWAFDRDDLGAQLNIHVYIGDEGHGYVIANVERTDVNNVYGCGNYHGFSATLNTALTGTQNIRVFAINVGGGSNVLIGSSTVNIQKDTSAPEISDVKISNVDTTGYTVSCTVKDNIQLKEIRFPTWTSEFGGNNGQDDITWDTISLNGTQQTVNYRVKIDSHNGELGTYATHIYLQDVAGNEKFYGAGVHVPRKNCDLEKSFVGRIIGRGSNKALTVDDNNNLFISPKAENDLKQLFEFTKYDDGTYKIKSLYNNTCIDVPGASAEKAVAIKMHADNGTPAQKWNIYKHDGYYMFRAECTPFVADVPNNVSTDGTSLQTCHCNGGVAQLFSIEKQKYLFNCKIELPAEAAVFEGDDEITISGFACSEEEINAVKLRVNSAIYDVDRFDRKDIKEKYPNAINGNEGFSVKLPISAFKYGTNTANIIIIDKDKKYNEFGKINFTVYKSYEPVNVGYYNGKIYAVYDDVNSWNEAKEFCETRGGSLVAITTKAEQNYVTSLLKNSNVSQYWIGATRGSGDTYSWVTGENFAYNNWNSGEPNNNNGTENCVVMFKNGKWNDEDAVNPYPCGFIYEFDANALEVSQYSTFGESEYYLYNKSVPYAIAEKYSEINGGIILNIGGAEEENVIYDMIAKTNGAVDRVWISLNDKENEGDFKWDNKEPLDYENWITGQPDDYNGVEDYTTLIYNSGWNDVKADYNETDKIGFVVKYSTDINQSGKNDNIDATMLIRHISGIENLTNDQYSRADINGDGKVDIKDVTEILNKM